MTFLWSTILIIKGASSIFFRINFLLNVSVMMFTHNPPLINVFGTRLFFTIIDIMGITSSNAFAVTWYIWVGCFDFLSFVDATIIFFAIKGYFEQLSYWYVCFGMVHHILQDLIYPCLYSCWDASFIGAPFRGLLCFFFLLDTKVWSLMAWVEVCPLLFVFPW